jgi:cytochrome P450
MRQDRRMNERVPPRGRVPVYEADFYSDAFILDPHPRYAEMRALGPVVWMARHGNYALTRYDEVRAALRNHKVFSSARGVAADQFGCDFMKGNTIGSDPPFHDLMRATMIAPLTPTAIEAIRPRIERGAEHLIDRLVARGSFEGIRDLARHLPLTIVTELVGLPEDGRENMLSWAAGGFDIFGVQNERGRRGVETVQGMREYILAKAVPGRLKPGSWTARIFELAARGEIPGEICPLLVRDYIGPSLDTTIAATGQLVYQLGKNPDQFERLRREPALIPNASNEAVRLSSPIRSLTRTLTADCEIGGTVLPADARVMMVYASANRDERKFDRPDQFDVTRASADHLGFGNGIHMCAGMRLARLEMDSLLKAMITRVGRIEVGEPTVALNNTICSFGALPARFTPASSH